MTTPIGTIDIRPSWAHAVEICLAALQDGTETGKALAREELRRMAKVLDENTPQQTPAWLKPDESLAHIPREWHGKSYEARDAAACELEKAAGKPYAWIMNRALNLRGKGCHE